MSDSPLKRNRDDEGGKLVEKEEVIVQNLHVKDAPAELPDEVFPISMAVTTDRKTRDDSKHPDIREPDYPVTAWRADPMPYIPSKRVYFFNPAEVSNQPGEDGRYKTWMYPEFVSKLDKARDTLELEDPSFKERMYMSAVNFVEIPSEYVKYEDKDENEVPKEEVEEYREDLGHTPSHINTRADHSLYEDREEMVIGRFSKRQSIRNQKIKKEMREAMPGNVIKPLKLTEIAVVHAKEHRGSYNTTAASTKRKYFSTAQAEEYNNMDLRPVFYRTRDDWDDDDADTERPLEIAVSEFDARMPKLFQSQFIARPTFEGYMDQQSTFVYTRLKGLEGVS